MSELELLVELRRKDLSVEERKKIRDKIFDIRYEKTIHRLETMEPFCDVEHIPDVPKLKTPEEYEQYVVKNFIRCGAIPKSQLEKGCYYQGKCRNAREAMWDGNVFSYPRTKMGSTFNEKINHFQDDNGFDLFVPIKKI